jgi:uncharacterized protein (DUF58 family)
MLPTRTTVVLFTLSLLLLPACLFYPPGRWLVLGYDGGLLLLLFTDVLLAHRSGRLQVRRERPARLSVGVDNEILVVVENPGGRALSLLVRDQPPAGFPAEPAVLPATVPAHGWVRLSYRLLPTERGNFTFGDVCLRLRGPLGLAWLDRTVSAAEEVPVYPNLLEVRRYEALVRATLVRKASTARTSFSAWTSAG